MNQFVVVAASLVMAEVFVVMADAVARRNMQYIARLIRPDTGSKSAVGFAVNQIVNACHFNFN